MLTAVLKIYYLRSKLCVSVLRIVAYLSNNLERFNQKRIWLVHEGVSRPLGYELNNVLIGAEVSIDIGHALGDD